MLPKKKNTEVELVEGGEVDVHIDLKRSYNPNQERKVWVRGKVLKLTDTHVQIGISEDPTPLIFGRGSFEFTTAGKKTPDYEWRVNLKSGDMVDGYDRGRWHPSTILWAKQETVNGLPKVEIRLAFRIYPKLCENWTDFKKYWPERQLAKDSSGDEFLGDTENMDETLPYYTRRIAK